ncbi:MAG: hypothetical protein AAGD01_15680 [Acidobacteriota bacterium]
MNLSAPKQIVFIIALVLALISLLAATGIFTIAPLAPYTYWLAFAAWLLLSLGCLLKGV